MYVLSQSKLLGYLKIMNLKVGQCVLITVICQFGLVVRAADDAPSTTEHSVDGIDVGSCQFAKHNSFTEKQKEALWKLSELFGKRFKTDDTNIPHEEGADTFEYNLGICTTAEIDQSEESLFAVTQHSQKNENSPQVVLGRYNDTTFMSGTDWVMLEYRSGDAYGHHCKGEGRRSIVMVICSPSETVGKLRIIEENNLKNEGCFYLFELEHKAACIVEHSGLSIGSIICIVFVSVLAVYLVGGFFYQRFVVGAKGLEQLPNYHFWQDFGNLQADGCDLICRCGHTGNTRSYRGLGDDQLTAGQEDDPIHDDRDDHLLPM